MRARPQHAPERVPPAHKHTARARRTGHGAPEAAHSRPGFRHTYSGRQGAVHAHAAVNISCGQPSGQAGPRHAGGVHCEWRAASGLGDQSFQACEGQTRQVCGSCARAALPADLPKLRPVA